MGTRFRGWPEQAYPVLLELGGEPSDGHEILGDVMQRVPRGYPVGHPRAGLLRHRSLIAARELESGAVRDAGPVYRACERLRPLLGWLAGHTVVAPPGARAAAGPR